MVGSVIAALSRLLVVVMLAAAVPAVTAGPADAKRIRKPKITTHLDPAPKGAKKKRRRFRPGARSAALATQWGCTETSGDRAPFLSNAPQIKVIYAYGAGQTDNLASYGDLIQADAAAIADKVASESGGAKSVRFDVGGTGGAADVCTNDSRNRLDIQTVQLAQAPSYYTDNSYSKLIDELTTTLHPSDPNQRVNYLVYLDGVHPPDALQILGVADLGDSPSHGYDNPLNQGRNGRGQLFAFVFGYGGSDFNGGYGPDERRRTFLHELSHTLGAVQFNAPHTSGAGHCYDGADIMCYDDGGPYFENGGFMQSICAGSSFASALDCNQDDYFNPDPATGSYLATNWNEFDSVFLCPVSECDTSLPAFSATVSTGRVDGKFALIADTGGVPVAHYEWNLDGDDFFEVDTGSTPSLSPQFTSSGTKKIELRAVKADGSFAYASTTITLHLPVASLVVSGTRLVNSPLTLDGSGSSDPDQLIQRYRWDLDSNSTFETDSGMNPVVTTSYATPGTKTAGLQLDYGFGFTQTLVTIPIPAVLPVATVPVVPPPPAPPSLTALTVRLARLLKSGMPLTVRCNAPCTVLFSLSIDRKTAKRFHLKARGKSLVIGRARGQFAAGTVKPVIKLTASAKNALRKARKLKLKLAGSIRQVGVSPLTVTKVLSFRR